MDDDGHHCHHHNVTDKMMQHGWYMGQTITVFGNGIDKSCPAVYKKEE